MKKLILLMGAALLLLCGCAQTQPQPASATAQPSESAGQTVRVYWPDYENDRIVYADLTMPADADPAVFLAQALKNPPDGLAPALTADTRILGMGVQPRHGRCRPLRRYAAATKRGRGAGEHDDPERRQHGRAAISVRRAS